MSEWISVHNEIPRKTVLVHYLNGLNKHRIAKAFYADKFEVEENHNEVVDWLDYDEKTDNYYLPQGWYETIDNWDDFGHVQIPYEITHFMPLPKIPED